MTRYLAWLLAVCILFGMTGCTPQETVDKVTEVLKEQQSPEDENAQEESALLEKEEAESLPEKEITEEQAVYYYGYNTLEEAEKKVYRQIAAGLESFQEEFPVEAVSKESLEKIVELVMTDHPEYFWTDGTCQYSYKEWPNGTMHDLKLQPIYQATQAEAEALQSQIEAKAQEWIGQIPPEAGTYERIKFVYETLIENVKYDLSSEQNQNIRSVFLGDSTVCMGYSKAAQYLLNKMGIFCTLVTGTVSKAEVSNHAWNLVKIGEQYYYMDITWGNPGYLNPTDQDMYISYSYLCCTQDTLAPTHTADALLPLPQCTDDSYNYYKNKGCWYEAYNQEQIYQVLLNEIANGIQMTELKFATQEAYEAAAADMVEGDLIREAVQSSDALIPGQTYSWQTYYGGSDNLLIIVWQ